jgi:abortive infection bacteriophage resistance protein
MRNSAGLFFAPRRSPDERKICMIYSKEALSLEEQADRLIGRGLVADRDELIGRLKVVNYYRLSGYLYPFRIRNASGKAGDTFEPGTNLEIVWRRYNFDRRLRIILLDAIERIEVAVRTRFVFHFVQAHGPFGYLNEKNLPGFKKRPLWKRCWRNLKALAQLRGLERPDYQQWLGKLQNEKKRASDTFVKHFTKTYGDHHEHLPLWMACELMTCETALQLAYGVDRDVLKKAAADFGFPDEQLLSWTKAIFTLRNSCAHHARVWNRAFGVKPSIPGKNKNPNWHIRPGFAPERIGLQLTVCYHWLGKLSSTTRWRDRLFTLFDEYPEIPLDEMGLPAGWRTHPLWNPNS